MLYPQWTAGEKITTENSTFTRPFSQIPAGSPMIRLRIGDVIKSNYSRFNLSRIFGSGARSTLIHPKDVRSTSLISYFDEIISLFGVEESKANNAMQEFHTDLSAVMLKVFLLALGSPLQFVDLIERGGSELDDKMKFTAGSGGILADVAYGLLFQALGSGFISPLVADATDRLRNPDGDGIKGWGGGNTGAKVGYRDLLKPTMGNFYYSPADKTFKTDGKNSDLNFVGDPKKEINDLTKTNKSSNTKEDVTKIMIDRHLKCAVVGRKQKKGKTYFNVVAIESAFGTGTSSELKGRLFTVTQDDFVIDPDHMFDNYFGWFLDPMTTLIDKVQDMIDMWASSAGIPTDNISIFTTSFEDFMHPVNNSITKAFETSSGRGLAGFIDSMSFSLISGDATPWEISYGSRAPKIIDVKMKFLPVHDISPGLDSDGFTRAPTHNVGTIMNNITDDPYGGGFEKGMKQFTTAAEQSIKDFSVRQSPQNDVKGLDSNPIKGD